MTVLAGSFAVPRCAVILPLWVGKPMSTEITFNQLTAHSFIVSTSKVHHRYCLPFPHPTNIPFYYMNHVTNEFGTHKHIAGGANLPLINIRNQVPSYPFIQRQMGQKKTWKCLLIIVLIKPKCYITWIAVIAGELHNCLLCNRFFS
jgi:hypothetical protein